MSNLTKGCAKHECTVKKASGLCSESAMIAKKTGMTKNKKKPDIRCIIDTIAVIGKRIVNKLRFIGRLLTDCKPFNEARGKRLADYTLNLISITNP